MTGYNEAVSWFRADPGRVRDLDDVDNRSAAITIVNAVLAGDVPAGRDLTAQDVRDAVEPGRIVGRWHVAADRLNRIARPSGGAGAPVSGTGEQDEHRDWAPGVGRHDPMSQPPGEWLDYLADLPGRSVVWSTDADRSPRSWSLPAPPPDDVTVVHGRDADDEPVLFDRLDANEYGPLAWQERSNGDVVSWSAVLDWSPVVEGEPPAPEPQSADGLTAEQYRHIYDDLIRGLAVDLGLDPDKAGGGSITAAVRRLVAGVSVPQKSTESPAGARCEHGVPVTRWCAGCTLTEQPPDGDR